MFLLVKVGFLFFPFIITLGLVFLWYRKDCKVDQGVFRENFFVLMMIFGWSAFLGWLLKVGIDLLNSEGLNLKASVIVFLEELIKASSLILGLEIAKKRFNEVSDGVVYGVVAALGYVFVENGLYLTAFQSSEEFLMVLVGRSILPLSIHILTTSFFGVTYAVAYLGYKKFFPEYQKKFKLNQQINLVKPHFFGKHLRLILFIGNPIWNFLKMFFCFDLLKRIYWMIKQKESHLLKKDRFLVFPSVFILEGFLLAFYLHLFLNIFLISQFWGTVLAMFLPLGSFILYLSFYLLDE